VPGSGSNASRGQIRRGGAKVLSGKEGLTYTELKKGLKSLGYTPPIIVPRDIWDKRVRPKPGRVWDGSSHAAVGARAYLIMLVLVVVVGGGGGVFGSPKGFGRTI
jgi:hypothetical protein